MKQTNHYEEMMRYGNSLATRTRLGKRRYPAMTYNDRSPEVAAINARLRASSYPEQTEEKRLKAKPRLTSNKMLMRTRIRSFLRLGDQYVAQARENFIREAVLFALIAAVAV